MAQETIVVRGLRDLNKAFALAGKDLKKQLVATLKEAAEPVRVAAEHRAVAEIRNLRAGDPWSLMRTGVTQRFVYVVPQQRGRRRKNQKRPKFADLMMDRAMAPALEDNIDEVQHRVDVLLADLGHDWERV